MTGEKPREIAARILRRGGREHDQVENALDQELSRAALSPQDRALCHELVYGVVRWRATLDWLIARKTGARAQNITVQLLLRLGLYQLFWLQRIPNHAAVHETVELGKQLGLGHKTGFLNAVLRGFTREREETMRLLEALKKSDPALGYSHPKWLVDRWLTRWGQESTTRLLEWNNRPPPTFARVNNLKCDAALLTKRWSEEGIGFEARQWDWTGEGVIFELQSHPPFAGWGSFQEGLFYVQDPSTLLAVRELNPQPGETILDACAAPGGKTMFIAQLMQNRGRIVARDSQPDRLKLVEENCARLGVTCVETGGDAQFDKILVDAPCSNTGVMRRRLDLRWRIRIEEIQRLRKLQLSLLEQCLAQLKPGGTLVYSTCSLESEENEKVAVEFLGAHPNLRLQNQRQLLPFVEGVDGAFVAIFSQ